MDNRQLPDVKFGTKRDRNTSGSVSLHILIDIIQNPNQHLSHEKTRTTVSTVMYFF